MTQPDLSAPFPEDGIALERERLIGMPRWNIGDGRPVFTNTPAEVAARRKILREYRTTKRGGTVADRTCRRCGGQILSRKAKRFCSVACYKADLRHPACKGCGKRRPAAAQRLCLTCARRAAAAARIENVEWLLGQGESPWQVLIQLDTNVRQLSAFLRRHNRYDLAEAFYPVEAEVRSAA